MSIVITGIPERTTVRAPSNAEPAESGELIANLIQPLANHDAWAKQEIERCQAIVAGSGLTQIVYDVDPTRGHRAGTDSNNSWIVEATVANNDYPRLVQFESADDTWVIRLSDGFPKHGYILAFGMNIKGGGAAHLPEIRPKLALQRSVFPGVATPSTVGYVDDAAATGAAYVADHDVDIELGTPHTISPSYVYGLRISPESGASYEGGMVVNHIHLVIAGVLP